MMLLKIKKLGEGLHPSETLVSVETKNGPEEVAVDARSESDLMTPSSSSRVG